MEIRAFLATFLIASVGIVRGARADEPLPKLPEPAPAPSPPSAEPAPAEPPPSYTPRRERPRHDLGDESQFVEVTLDADGRGAWLEGLTEHPAWVAIQHRWHAHVVRARRLRWEPICQAPCTIRVPPQLVYRVAGSNVTASEGFSVGPPGSKDRLHAATGSQAARTGGVIALALGIPSAVVGGAIALASPHADDSRTAGYVVGGVGLGLVVMGAILVITSATNVYDDSRGQVGSTKPTLVPGGLVF